MKCKGCIFMQCTTNSIITSVVTNKVSFSILKISFLWWWQRFYQWQLYLHQSLPLISILRVKSHNPSIVSVKLHNPEKFLSQEILLGLAASCQIGGTIWNSDFIRNSDFIHCCIGFLIHWIYPCILFFTRSMETNEDGIYQQGIRALLFQHERKRIPTREFFCIFVIIIIRLFDL